MSQPTTQPTRSSPREPDELCGSALNHLISRDPARHAHVLGTARAARRLAPTVLDALRRGGFLVTVGWLSDAVIALDGIERVDDPPWALDVLRRTTSNLADNPPAAPPLSSIPKCAVELLAERARVAGILHDVLRDGEGEPVTFPLDKLERAHPAKLHHGPLSAQWALDRGLRDAEVLFAVRYHTIGHPLPTPLLCTLMLADAVEETRDYPGVNELREQALTRPLEALAARLRKTTGYVLRHGHTVHPHALGQLELLERLNQTTLR